MPTIDLGYLKPTRTARYKLAPVHIPRSNPSPVTLLVRHAGRSNGPLKSALLKLAQVPEAERARQIVTLYAKHVITGWEDVLDQAGAPERYTSEAGAELLTALLDAERDDLVIGLRTFCEDADNFCDEPTTEAGSLGEG